MNIFITASNDYYKETKEYSVEHASKYGRFDRVLSYNTERDIDDTFKRNNKVILSCKTGAGLWLWKPYFINKALIEETKEGDYLFYCDAASFFVKDVNLIIEIMRMNGKDILACQTPLKEKYFTKEETFQLMECTGDIYRESNQYHASFMCFKKNENTLSFVKDWLNKCCDYHLLYPENTDNKYTNITDFVAHREDQSIFSLLCKKHNVVPSYDPSQYGVLQDWYAVKGIPYCPVKLKREYPVCIYLHKTRDINPNRIKSIKTRLLLPSFVRNIISFYRLKKLGVK